MDYVLRGIIEKRKKISEDDEDEYEELFRGRRRKIIGEVCNEDDFVELAGAFVVASRPRKRRRRGRKIERDKSWWENGYLSWDDEVFRHHLRISRTPFEILVDSLRAYLQKTPTNACPVPISPEKQFALTLYRLAHGTSYLTTGALFGVSYIFILRNVSYVNNVYCFFYYHHPPTHPPQLHPPTLNPPTPNACN